MPPSATLVWFRSDLRTADNPAVQAALTCGGPVIPVYIRHEEAADRWSPGSASRWWLHHSLCALQADLQQRGSRLILRSGEPHRVLRDLLRETGATGIVWNRRYEPDSVARDTRLKQEFGHRGIAVQSCNGALLHEPGEIRTRSGMPYQVFTPFSRACLERGEPAPPAAAPGTLPAPPVWPLSEEQAEWQLLPRIPWDAEFSSHWQPGARGAEVALQGFVQGVLGDYRTARDYPAVAGTSRLSPHLHFGEMSVRQVWHVLRNASRSRKDGELVEPYYRQLLWREFAAHLLYHFPHTTEHPLREEFSRFPWLDDAAALRAWQRGETGYPLVDAGMRQLWRTGWMHNRVRMIVGSFLVKDLLISWQSGARWFWETLVDADLANNTLGWQWIGGCGADAAPYFRIFNPVSQGMKFDRQGDYVRRWVPELSGLGPEWIHQPWAAPVPLLYRAGIELGRTYPQPLVDHAAARTRALAALQTLKHSS